MSAPKNHEIKISDWKTHTRNTLRGFFTATLPSGMVLHDLQLHQKSDGRWINFPSREWIDTSGDTQYAQIITFTNRATADRFRDSVLEALDQQRPWDE